MFLLNFLRGGTLIRFEPVAGCAPPKFLVVSWERKSYRASAFYSISPGSYDFESVTAARRYLLPAAASTSKGKHPGRLLPGPAL
ncbi:MAG: hypothetical protein WCD43_14570 [Candidatus Acidiferrales bacterium]